MGQPKRLLKIGVGNVCTYHTQQHAPLRLLSAGSVVADMLCPVTMQRRFPSSLCIAVPCEKVAGYVTSYTIEYWREPSQDSDVIKERSVRR